MNKKDPVINQETVDSLIHGDSSAFSIVYEKLKGEVFTYAHKIVRSRTDAEDITVTAFGKLWTHKPKLDSPAHLKNWLFITTRNMCLNTLRDHQYTYELKEQMVGTFDPNIDRPAVEREQIWTSAVERLWEMVRQLPPMRRKVIQLRFGDNKSVEQIAMELGLSAQTVRNHLARGRNQMQEMFSKGPLNENDLFLLILLLGLLKLHQVLH